ncbi:hypothetical protein [Sphingomonas sp. RS2018]
MVALALIACCAAVLIVRAGWAGRVRLAHTGWAVAAAALLALMWRDGAWGLAIGIVAGSVTALALVLYAAWISPAKVRRPSREAPAITIPYRLPDILRRLAVFVLAVPVAFAAAQWLVFGAQAFARHAGVGESDATVLTLALQPVLWGAIVVAQLTRANAARMIAPPAVAALVGTLLWSAA